MDPAGSGLGGAGAGGAAGASSALGGASVGSGGSGGFGGLGVWTGVPRARAGWKTSLVRVASHELVSRTNVALRYGQ